MSSACSTVLYLKGNPHFFWPGVKLDWLPRTKRSLKCRHVGERTDPGRFFEERKLDCASAGTAGVTAHGSRAFFP
jgi:hypothetical protein